MMSKESAKAVILGDFANGKIHYQMKSDMIFP